MFARYQGRLEGIRDGSAHGWVVDRRHPQNRVVVTLRSDEGWRTNNSADHYRADLYRAGLGDGHHGFSVPLPELPPSTFQAFVTETGTALKGRLRAGEPAPNGRLNITRSALLFVDEPTRGRFITGWLVDPTDAWRRPVLTLSVNGKPVARDRATRFRPDSRERGMDGLHGFMLTWATAVSGTAALVDEDGTVLTSFRVRA